MSTDDPTTPSDAPTTAPTGTTGTTGRRRSASSRVSLAVAALVLAALVVFILQNPEPSRVQFLMFSVELRLGVSLLVAAVAGALVVGVVAGARVLKLRRALRRR